MHANSFFLVSKIIERHLSKETNLSVIDVGSFDVNGSYKPLFRRPNWYYTGLDLKKGRNVDIVAKSPRNWSTKQRFDLAISGQTMEHTKDLCLFADKLSAISKYWVLVVAPNAEKEHRYPVDCWRIMPDGMRWLFVERNGIREIECGMKGNDTYFFGEKT